MQCADVTHSTWKCYIDCFLFKREFVRLSLNVCSPVGNFLFKRVLQLIDGRSELRAFVLREGTDGLQLTCDKTLLAKEIHANMVKFLLGLGRGNGGERFGLQRLETVVKIQYKLPP